MRCPCPWLAQVIRPDQRGSNAVMDVKQLQDLHRKSELLDKLNEDAKLFVCGTVTTEASWKNLKAGKSSNQQQIYLLYVLVSDF